MLRRLAARRNDGCRYKASPYGLRDRLPAGRENRGLDRRALAPHLRCKENSRPPLPAPNIWRRLIRRPSLTEGGMHVNIVLLNCAVNAVLPVIARAMPEAIQALATSPVAASVRHPNLDCFAAAAARNDGTTIFIGGLSAAKPTNR